MVDAAAVGAVKLRRNFRKAEQWMLCFALFFCPTVLGVKCCQMSWDPTWVWESSG